MPELHSSVVQTLLSTGRSALSLKTCELPAPSHCSPLQSPAVGSTSLVFAAVKLNPQTPAAEQVRRAAGGVGARAVRGDRAPDALAVCVAVVGAAAVGVRGHHRVRRRARRADVVGARVAVLGHVGVVVGVRDGAVGRALAALAVARGLHRQHGASGLAHAAADAGGTGAVLALRTRCPDSQRRRCRRRRSCPPCTRRCSRRPTRQGLPGPHFPQWPPQSTPVSSLFLMPSEQVGAPSSAGVGAAVDATAAAARAAASRDAAACPRRRRCR